MRVKLQRNLVMFLTVAALAAKCQVRLDTLTSKLDELRDEMRGSEHTSPCFPKWKAVQQPSKYVKLLNH